MATKFEILQRYAAENDPEHLFATWYALGRNKIVVSTEDSRKTTRAYTRGILYYLDCKLSELDRCLIYCEDDYFGLLEWEKATLEDSYYGYISFGNNILSSNFKFVSAASQEYIDFCDTYVPTSDFVPFKDEFESADVVQIKDEDYALCTACLGTPFIMDTSLEYTRDQITNLAIRPSLEEYYKWFPKVQIDTYRIGGSVQDVEFPKDAYDIVHYSIQQYGNNANGMITNTLLRAWTESMYGINNQVGRAGSTTSLYSNGMENYFNNRAYSQAILNYNTRSHIDKYIKDGKKYARFYSIKMGTAEIHWAIKTLNFNEVEFARRPELIKLCNANVKLLFGNIRRQAKSDIPGLVDYKEWVTEAKTEIQEVREDWQKLVKYAGVMRGSL